MRHGLLLLLLAATSGCVELGPAQPLRIGDFEEFRVSVQPVLAAECASASCHGRVARPLALYAPGALRMDPAATFRDESVTEPELRANMRRLAAMAAEGDPAQSAVLLKPLTEAAGGHAHGGGDVFSSPGDPGYVLLLDWLEAAR